MPRSENVREAVATATPVRLRTLGVAFLWAMLYFTPMLAMHALAIPGFVWSVRGTELFLLLPMLAVVTLPLALLGLAWRSWSRGAASLAVWSLAVLLAMVVTLALAGRLRMFGFALAADRAEPLVTAIGRHVADRGAPPERLRDLVPAYLPRLPGRLPPLTIVTGDEARRVYGGNDWVLRAPVPIGLLNWDEWLYFPNGAYPARGYGGWLERVGAWAYVHE
ncbi:MAG: hypothetical protein KAI24_12870 [Planctomycetes bacterium]|nr:hypothetical protein [Planctomycetota bacterium]